MKEFACYFSNQSEKQLFAYHHFVENNTATKAGVVFCHPFGEEKHRSYRALVKFSRHLASNGIPSLRFDMMGAGDSDGELIEASVNSCVTDVSDAVTQLIRKHNVEQVILIGLRFGATIAALVAEKDPRINSIVLLSPIVKGANYWRELLRTKQFASITLNQPAVKTATLMKKLTDTGKIEIEAQFLSDNYVNQLKEINLLKQENINSKKILLTGLKADVLGNEFAQDLSTNYIKNGNQCTVWSEEERDYWTILSLYDQYYPLETFEFVTQWILGTT